MSEKCFESSVISLFLGDHDNDYQQETEENYIPNPKNEQQQHDSC